MSGGVTMTVEELKIEIDLKLQVLEDKIDAFIASNSHSGIYMEAAPDYVREYVASKQLEGEKK